MNYEWTTTYTARKPWRQREWGGEYWISYGFYSFTLSPFGTWLYVTTGDIVWEPGMNSRKIWSDEPAYQRREKRNRNENR